MNQHEYVQKVIGTELSKLSSAEKGNRNNQLNASAYVLGRLVGGGSLSEWEVEEWLVQACTQNGLIFEDARAIKNTIRSGLKAGMSKPKYVSQNGESSEIEYPYHDKDGSVVAVKVRKIKRNGKKTFLWKRFIAEKNAWAIGLKEGEYEPKNVGGALELHKTKGEGSKNIISLDGIG